MIPVYFIEGGILSKYISNSVDKIAQNAASLFISCYLFIYFLQRPVNLGQFDEGG